MLPESTLDSAVRLQCQSGDVLQIDKAGIEGLVQRAISIQPGQMLASLAGDNREISANQKSSVRLDSQRVYAFQRIAPANAAMGHRKGAVHRTIGVEPGDRFAWDPVNTFKNPADQDLSVC